MTTNKQDSFENILQWLVSKGYVFCSDEEAKEAGLKEGDPYKVKPDSKPYFLPEGTIKRVL